MDLAIAKENLKLLNKRIKDKIFPISSKTGEGIGVLIGEIRHRLRSYPQQ